MNNQGKWTLTSPRRKPGSSDVNATGFRLTTAGMTAFLILFLLPCASFAISDSAGTSAGAFLKIPTDARGLALGPAIVSMAEGTEAMRWNPAALGRLDTHELSGTHIAYYQDVSVENVAFAHPLDRGAVAANIFYLAPDKLEGRDALGNHTGDFTFYDLAASIGYGRQLRSREEGGADLYIGGALKIVQEKIADTQYQNAAVDAGLLLLPNENLRVGVSAQNLSTGKADFPKLLTAGASYTFIRALTGGFAIGYADDAPLRMAAGAEYKFPELQGAAVRAGYQSRDEVDDSLDSGITAFRKGSLAGLSLGAGFAYRPPQFKTLHLLFDYGMAPFGALGISHTMTVKLRW
ncbi:MAG: hypothetical protein A2992_01125 [Elusimicrobia bacterium RIFCSPLOWO2_01_FULL_59_12]|nr:MAG: hypothetical protein A2992_01125 [Elusimicrobia bacterium RIFCSPLOWO2_01_FULL_59_12]